MRKKRMKFEKRGEKTRKGRNNKNVDEVREKR